MFVCGVYFEYSDVKLLSFNNGDCCVKFDESDCISCEWLVEVNV